LQMLGAPGLHGIVRASPWLQTPAFLCDNCCYHRNRRRVLCCPKDNLRLLAYIRFIPLPASMNTLPTSYPPICALSTIGEWPGLGTFLGWSALLNLTGWSDHFRYSVVSGGDVIARLTYLDMLFLSFFDFGTRWIIADIYNFDSSCFVSRCIWYPWLMLFPPFRAPWLESMAFCNLRKVLQSFIWWLDTLFPSR
jgi:hypothetical protein